MSHRRRKGSWHPLLVRLVQFAVGNPKLARKLVKEHPEVLDLRTGLGETALHFLAVENYAGAVQLLIELGAEVNVTNEFGASALEEAMQVKADATVEVLRRAGAVDVHAPFDDPVLGRVVFDADSGEWRFTVPIRGRDVRGKIVPIDRHRPIAEPALAEIRDCVAWVRDNEPAVRDYVTDQMFAGWLSGWYDAEIDAVDTPEGFRDAIHLPGFFAYEEERALNLCYDDAGLFGGHAIVLTVAAGGRYARPPQVMG